MKKKLACPAKCGDFTCNENGDCCDESCIGCQANSTSQCLSCRYLTIETGSHRQCVKECPTNMYALKNYRCVTDQECRETNRPYILKDEVSLPEKPYIPRADGVCSYVCPSNYYADNSNGKLQCVKCSKGVRCKRECPGGTIDTISTAQLYHGCTHITGSFTINIKNERNRKYFTINIT